MHRNSLLIILFSLLFIGNANCQNDWVLESNTEGISLWTKDSPGSKIKQFKLKTTIESDIESAYHLLRDIEKMSNWYDRIKEVKLIKSINEDEGIYLLEYSLPFPFENRITTVKGSIDYNPIGKKLGVNTMYFESSIPKEKAGLVKVLKIWSSWEITTKTNNQLEIIHMGSMDPSGNIPQWLVNDGVLTGPIKTIKAFKKQLKKD
jgi:hypothetical protein